MKIEKFEKIPEKLNQNKRRNKNQNKRKNKKQKTSYHNNSNVQERTEEYNHDTLEKLSKIATTICITATGLYALYNITSKKF